jgi:hypothetical protein
MRNRIDYVTSRRTESYPEEILRQDIRLLYLGRLVAAQAKINGRWEVVTEFSPCTPGRMTVVLGVEAALRKGERA